MYWIKTFTSSSSSSGSSRGCCVSASGVLYVGWARSVGRARTFQMPIAIRKSVALMKTIPYRCLANGHGDAGSGWGPMWLTACVAATFCWPTGWQRQCCAALHGSPARAVVSFSAASKQANKQSLSEGRKASQQQNEYNATIAKVAKAKPQICWIPVTKMCTQARVVCICSCARRPCRLQQWSQLLMRRNAWKKFISAI